jgi:threonine-phosphate decarboxylase
MQDVQNMDCAVHERVTEGTGMVPRQHGGDVLQAARRYGIDSGAIIDFSSNVNHLGPSSAALRAAKKALSSTGRYPDIRMTWLRTKIARYFGIKPEQVMCGNGATHLIHLIPRVFRPAKVLIPYPTYAEYAAAAREAGAEVIPLPLTERTGFSIDPLDMAFALKGTSMAFLCNPNSPTGLLTPKAEMLEIVRYACEQGVRLVIDEAFMDFVEAESLVKEAVQARQVICIRTFSKFFGMPGLRLGYAVSDEATIDALRAAQEPWPISAFAEDAAAAALTDWRQTMNTLRAVEKERERLLSAIRILPGVETFPSATNFIFIKVAAPQAPLLVEKLALRRLLVRDCSSYPGLDNRFIRITVRSSGENKRLLRALRELLGR